MSHRMEPESHPASPLPALLLGAAGGALLGSIPRHRAARAAITLAGLTLIGVAAQHPLAQALRRAGTRRRATELHLSLVVPQPVEHVFAFCCNFENFPRLVGALRDVHDYGDGRSHWRASTPSGGTLEWDTVTTKYVTNRVIAWKSTGRSPIVTSGLIRFVPDHGHTCVKVSFSYQVLESSLADAVAALATPPRVRQLEADIRRLSELLERPAEPGRERAAATRV
jgi:uncharacterized membrane protein